MTEEATLIKKIEHIKRLTSSANGNPRFEFVFTDGSVHKGTPDAAYAYAVGNPDMREGCTVVIGFDSHGNIDRMGPHA